MLQATAIGSEIDAADAQAQAQSHQAQAPVAEPMHL
jgi:hypothetical protein